MSLPRAEGGCVSHIQPEHLLDLNEYKCWTELDRKHRDVEESSGYKRSTPASRDSLIVPHKFFHLVSKKAWLDCLLQLLKVELIKYLFEIQPSSIIYLIFFFCFFLIKIKVCILNRITPKLLNSMPVPFNKEAKFPEVKSDPLTSNVRNFYFSIELNNLSYHPSF